MVPRDWHCIQGPVVRKWPSIMASLDRGLSGPHLARLLGAWRSGGPAYAALAAAIRLLVLDGRLPLRTRLPGERELAAALGVSRTTAAAAYAALRDGGFLESRRGAGSWTRLPADAPGAGPAAAPPAGLIDLSAAATAAPEGALHRALAAATTELPRHLPGSGYEAAGLAALREAVAAHLTRRGAPPGRGGGGRRPPPPPAAARRRPPSRCSSPPAPSTRSRWFCASSPAPATACSSTTRPTRTRSTRSAPPGRGRCPSRCATTAGTSRCSPRRSARPRRGSRTSSPTTTTRPA